MRSRVGFNIRLPSYFDSGYKGWLMSEGIQLEIQISGLKFIYSEKATKFYKISTFLLSYVVPVKSKVETSQNFVAFTEYMNLKLAPSQLGE